MNEVNVLSFKMRRKTQNPAGRRIYIGFFEIEFHKTANPGS